MNLPASAIASGATDRALRTRASAVIPPTAFGHLDVVRSHLPANYPQFFDRGAGAHLWDVDGREFVDLMCAWGPMLVGYGNVTVESAVAAQNRRGDCLNGPSPRAVELAELLVDTIDHADWAMFAKNGNDATTTACTIARAATGRTKILKASSAYHGATPWFTPILGGVTDADRANLVEFAYNDLTSATTAAAAHDGDVAAIIVTPFRHDGFTDQEMPDASFARGVRELCDRIGAALILDEVRAGFRLSMAGSWEPLGVRPDLSAYSKAMANGHPIAAVLGTDALRDAVAEVYVTGSFWFAATPMAAALATLEQLRGGEHFEILRARGTQLRDGLAAQAAARGLLVHQSGPVQMPFLRFDDDPQLLKALEFCRVTLDYGTYLHPWHNWFLSSAHTEADIDAALVATAAGFDAVVANT